MTAALRFDRSFDLVIGHEGKLSLNPKDRGNWTGGKVGNGQLKGTKYGISAKSYPHLDIRNLTLDDARAIYLRDFWNRCGCDRWPDGVAYAVFDGGVNMGVGTVIRHMQAGVGAGVDGIIGPETRGKVDGADPVKLIRDLLVSRMFHYLSLDDFDEFGKGWTRRAFDVAIAATAMQMGQDVTQPPDNSAAVALLTKANADILSAVELLGKDPT